MSAYVTPLPDVPRRTDPATFAAKGDAFLGALEQFRIELMELAAQCEQNATTSLSMQAIRDGLMPTIDQAAPAGAMLHWPKSTPPDGWLVRDGSAISRTAYAELFAMIGTTYGAGDGATTFNLPDDRGLTPVGYKDGDSAFGTFGGTFGSKDAALVNHGHGVNDSGHAHGVYDPGHDHEERVCNIPGGVGGNFAAGTNADYGAHTGTYHTYGSTTGIGIYGSTTGISIQSSGGAATDKNIQPSRIYLPIIKY